MEFRPAPHFTRISKRDHLRQLELRSPSGIRAMQKYAARLHSMEARGTIEGLMRAAGAQVRELRKMESPPPDSPFTAESFRAVVTESTDDAIFEAARRHLSAYDANSSIVSAWRGLASISRALELIYADKGAGWRNAADILVQRQLEFPDSGIAHAAHEFAFRNRGNPQKEELFGKLIAELKLCDGAEYVRELAARIGKQ